MVLPTGRWQRWAPLWLGLAATTLMALGALGTRRLPRTSPYRGGVLEGLQTWLDRDLANVVLTIGTALILLAWLRLWNHPLRHRPWLLIGVWSLPLVFVPPIFSPDAYLYADLAWILHSGENPYVTGLAQAGGPYASFVESVWRGYTSPYPPLAQYVQWASVALTGYDPLFGVVALRLQAFVGVALMLWSVPALARHAGVQPGFAVWFGVLNPFVIVHFIGGAHNDALMTGLIAAAMRVALVRRRWAVIAAALLVGLATGVKQPALLMALPVALLARAAWKRERPRYGRPSFVKEVLASVPWGVLVGVTALATFIALSVASGLGFGWTNALDLPNKYGGISPPGIVYQVAAIIQDRTAGFVAKSQIADVISLVGRGLLVVVILVTVLRWGPRQPYTVATVVMLGVALSSISLYAWYLPWGLLFLGLTRCGPRVLRIAIGVVIGMSIFMLLINYYRMSLWWALGPSLMVCVMAHVGLRAMFPDGSRPGRDLGPGRRADDTADTDEAERLREVAA